MSWGEGTTDEMALVFVSITVDGERIGWRPPLTGVRSHNPTRVSEAPSAAARKASSSVRR